MYDYNVNKLNTPLVEVLLDKYRHQTLLSNIEIPSLALNVQDLSVFSLPKEIDCFESKDEIIEKINLEYRSVENLFEVITDTVFASNCSEVTPISIDLFYERHLKKLIDKVSDLFGVVGVDELTGEVINFTHPFRAISLKENNREIKVPKLFVYKIPSGLASRKPSVPYDTKMLMLYCITYKNNLISKKDEINKGKSYINLYDDRLAHTARIEIYSKDTSKATRFLYFSDILVRGSFMPHYNIMQINRHGSSLVAKYLKDIYCLTPNISKECSVCTGNIPSVSKDGVECLKISNLLSPYHQNLYHREYIEEYIQACILLAKGVYENVI